MMPEWYLELMGDEYQKTSLNNKFKLTNFNLKDDFDWPKLLKQSRLFNAKDNTFDILRLHDVHKIRLSELYFIDNSCYIKLLVYSYRKCGTEGYHILYQDNDGKPAYVNLDNTEILKISFDDNYELITEREFIDSIRELMEDSEFLSLLNEFQQKLYLTF